MLRSKRPWTDGEENTLHDLRATHTSQEIGEMLGRSQKSVQHHYQWMRVRKRDEVSFAGVSKAFLAYTAGIIDGEGHIGIGRTKNYFCLRVEVANTSSRLIDFLHLTFGGNVWTGKRPNRKVYYRWMISTRAADEFLRSISPYLLIKRNQADLALAFREELDVSVQEEMFHQMKLLHRYD